MTERSQGLAAPSAEGLARLNVEALIQQALENKAGVEQLERLVALAKDIRAEQAREAWYAAMADFQRLCPVIKKTASARITTSRSNYSYSYAPLDEILSTIQPVMGPLGLSISWHSGVNANHVIVNCRVAHKYGHHENSGDMAMPITTGDADRGANAAQRVAIAMTYAKRYSLLGIIGMAPEDDDDGSVRASGPVEMRRPAIPADEDGQSTANSLYEPDKPDVADLRAALLADVKQAADRLKLSAKVRADLWTKYCGQAGPDNVDPAALNDLAVHLTTR